MSVTEKSDCFLEANIDTLVGVSELAERFESRRNSQAVRWYVLTLPSCHRGPAVGLQRELDRRIRCGEPGFEFFAPSYVEVKNEDGHFVHTRRPLLYNYVFVRSSESEIYRMKQELPQYNFLPRVREGLRGYYPYLSDEAMRNLRWVARSYCDELPVYMPETERLAKGDRIRIIAGRFKGAEACVAIRPGGGQKDVVVCVENWMWVPLLHVRPGEYEIDRMQFGRNLIVGLFLPETFCSEPAGRVRRNINADISSGDIGAVGAGCIWPGAGCIPEAGSGEEPAGSMRTRCVSRKYLESQGT